MFAIRYTPTQAFIRNLTIPLLLFRPASSSALSRVTLPSVGQIDTQSTGHEVLLTALEFEIVWSASCGGSSLFQLIRNPT